MAIHDSRSHAMPGKSLLSILFSRGSTSALQASTTLSSLRARSASLCLVTLGYLQAAQGKAAKEIVALRSEPGKPHCHCASLYACTPGFSIVCGVHVLLDRCLQLLAVELGPLSHATGRGAGCMRRALQFDLWSLLLAVLGLWESLSQQHTLGAIVHNACAMRR